jgi:phospholipid/cholesterol/gamma-HCH transport system substrate-binding protein
MDSKEKIFSDLRVGIVTFLGILCLVAGITFAGGDKGLLFQQTFPLTANLTDINGLKKGSTVTMGGMSVGKVTDLTFLDGSAENLIHISMQVRADVAQKIHKDSKPSVRTQGMLGDRYVEISRGSAESPALEPGGSLLGSSASNFDDTLLEAKQTLSNTNQVLEAINKKEGSVGSLIYDPTLYKKLSESAEELNELLKDFKKNPRKYIKFSVF